MNIYYKGKSHPPGSVITSSVMSPENVTKLFESDYRGYSVPGGKRFPINSFAWSDPRFKGKFKVHPVFGKVFVPHAILATNGKVYYFIVLIGGKVGIRRWPSFASKNAYKLDHVNINSNELGMLEQCFTRLLTEVFPNKSIEQRFKKVKGVALKFDSLFDFVNIILQKSLAAKAIAREVFEAAENPVTYFRKNQRALSKLNIDEPEANLYRTILIERLAQHGKLAYLDWQSRAEEVNSVLKALVGKRTKPFIDPKVKFSDTLTMIKTAGKTLRAHRLIAFSILTDSDDYAIIVVKLSLRKEAESLAKACKLRMQTL